MHFCSHETRVTPHAVREWLLQAPGGVRERLKLAVAWGVNHNRGEVQEGRTHGEGENPLPHYGVHGFCVWAAASDTDDFIAKTEGTHLHGVADQITRAPARPRG